MTVTIKHSHGIVNVDQLADGKNRVYVELFDNNLFMPINIWNTSYSIDLIEKILITKGPNWLCDELIRDEDHSTVQNYITYAVLSYVKDKEFINKRLLDFGCGCGASTMVLGRLFPNAQIVGIDLVDKFISIAKIRAKHYKFNNMTFYTSPKGSSLPKSIGTFDYIFLNAVYEHLLPKERSILLPKICSHLKLGGVLFINETPYRYFPIESHTSGLPFINWFPHKITLSLTRTFSKRVQQHVSWKELLRMGIRGGTVKEIMSILNRTQQAYSLLKPKRLGIKDPSDIWFKAASQRKLSFLKKLLVSSAGFLKGISGIHLTPYLSLALKRIL